MELNEVLSIVMVCVSIVFIALYVRSLLKKEEAKILRELLIGGIAYATLAVVFVFPGSESILEFGPVKINIKTPSKLQKLIGDKDNTFKAHNTDPKKPNTVVFSASSTSPSVPLDLQFMEGAGYIKIIAESKDGKERIYSATIPAGKEIAVASPETVNITALPRSVFLKFADTNSVKWEDTGSVKWGDRSKVDPDSDEAKEIGDYHKSGNP